MTRPTYDPMRAPAPAFPRHRFSRVMPEEQVAALAAAYDTLAYGARVRFTRAVTSAPDQRLEELAAELSGIEVPETPAEPVPPSDPSAPAVNQTAAQTADAPPAPGATPTSLTGETSAPAAAPTPPPIPPPDQLPQLKVPELQQLAEQAGVPKTGTKAELVDRLTAATGEQAAVTPEQVAADAASAPQAAPDASPQPETPATATGAADGPQVAPATPAAPADGTPTTDGATP